MFTILVGVIVGLLVAGAISFMSEFKKIALGLLTGLAIILISIGVSAFTVIKIGRAHV